MRRNVREGQQLPLTRVVPRFRFTPNSRPQLKLIEWPKGANCGLYAPQQTFHSMPLSSKGAAFQRLKMKPL